MIWFDLVTPKSVLFFKEIISRMDARGVKTLITTREGNDYHEVVDLLDLYKIPYFSRGRYGGEKLSDKLRASIGRQADLVDLLKEFPATQLVSISSVDANRVAFGLGIPIVNFNDIPLTDWRFDLSKVTPQARLTLPLSSRIFRSYIVPQEIYERFSIEPDRIHTYRFLDVLLWLKDFRPSREVFEKTLNSLQLDSSKPTILIREEEFQASYVLKKWPFLYEGVRVLRHDLDVNLIFIPRYDSRHLQEMFPGVSIISEKMVIQHLLAFSDLFIGGGGMLNCEACYFGIPTISTRSFVCHYDKALIEANLMEKADSALELVVLAKRFIGRRRDPTAFFQTMVLDIDLLVDLLLE